MDLRAAGLDTQPFGTDGKPSSVVSYSSYRDAIAVLNKTLEAPHGLSLLQGPALSGKSTLIREFVPTISSDCAVAVVDGTNLNTANLLQKMLRRFGYRIEFNSIGELLAMIRVFAMQQATAHEPPLVIIENAHALNPSALRATAELAELRVRHQGHQHSAIKIILASDQSLQPLLQSPGLESLAKRMVADFHLHPLTRDEAANYLHSKLKAAGCKVPEFVFPSSVCTELWQASGGWPGILDRIASLALDRADTLPVAISTIDRPDLPNGTWDADNAPEIEEVDETPEPPKLYITENGKTVQVVDFVTPRILIGRSEHNDLQIDSRFISRHHMLLVRHGGSTFLMDLNSTNGTMVNSRRVSNHVLVDSDIVSVGNHRIKFSDPHAVKRGDSEGAELADTAIMKSLDDMRALLEQENTAELPASENIPTYTGNNTA